MSPLGSGALAGAGYPLDREETARELGFDGVTQNSLDAVGDRDFAVEVLGAVALGMVHLSRLSEELIWWSNPGFGFVRVADRYATGSSMMPNKRNPDPAELIRGRTARAIAALNALLGILKGLPLGYQRDIQEDKSPLFGAAICTRHRSPSSPGWSRASRSTGRHGGSRRPRLHHGDDPRGRPRPSWRPVPVGASHRRCARCASGTGGGSPSGGSPHRRLEALLSGSDDAAARRLADEPGTAADVLAMATIEASIAAADVIGGTAGPRVADAIAAARKRLDDLAS